MRGATIDDVEALARRHWAEREATFPAFTRQRWEDGSYLARQTSLVEAEVELRASTPTNTPTE